MTDTIPVDFVVNAEALSQIEGLNLKYGRHGSYLGFTVSLDETLIESLSDDELIEFIGIDSEFLVYVNVKE